MVHAHGQAVFGPRYDLYAHNGSQLKHLVWRVFQALCRYPALQRVQYYTLMTFHTFAFIQWVGRKAIARHWGFLD